MLIPHHKIEEVLARADVVAVVGRHVSLKKAGRSYKGCCPFHAEKTPSFYVTPERHMWKCFGCGVGGDAISFLMRLLGKGFVETVRELAREVSVDLGAAEDPAAQERARLRQVNELAQQHFGRVLADERKGRLARDYLRGRGVSDESIRLFGLGYAASSWNDLSDRIVQEGAVEASLKAGLLSPRQKGQGHYDTFRGRLMIPIRSPEGRIIAFGGRLLEGDQGPKYLNSRESPLYVKAEVLYGLDLAREPIRRSGAAVLVEGYFDAIGLHQAGVKNAVALCSTTLTDRHLALLQRHGAKELVLLLDGDAAGAKAVERLAGPILAHGATAKVAVLPEGLDPDDYAQKAGPQAVQALITQALPLTEHLLQRALPRGAQAGWEEKIAALRALRPVLDAMGPSLERTLFIARLASHLGVPEAEVQKALGPGAQRPAAPVPAAAAPASAPAREPASRSPAVSPSEELLCALLLADASLSEAPGAEAVDEIAHLGLRHLLEEACRSEDVAALWGSIDPQLARRVQRKRGEILSRWPSAQNRREAVAHAARQVRLTRVEERLLDLRGEFERLGSDDLTDDHRTLLEEQQRLKDLRTRLTRPARDDAEPETVRDGRNDLLNGL